MKIDFKIKILHKDYLSVYVTVDGKIKHKGFDIESRSIDKILDSLEESINIIMKDHINETKSSME